MATNIKLPKEAFSDQEVILLSKSEYLHLKSQHELADALVSIAIGEQELQSGTAIEASSIASALTLYAKRPNNQTSSL